MSEEKSIIKPHHIRWDIVIPVSGFVIALAGFYYDTNSSLAAHKEDISSLKIEIKSKASTDDMHDLKQDIHDLQASNQKILEILIEKQK